MNNLCHEKISKLNLNHNEVLVGLLKNRMSANEEPVIKKRRVEEKIKKNNF